MIYTHIIQEDDEPGRILYVHSTSDVASTTREKLETKLFKEKYKRDHTEEDYENGDFEPDNYTTRLIFPGRLNPTEDEGCEYHDLT